MNNIETYTVYVSSECNCMCLYCYLRTNKMKLNKTYTKESIKILLDDICSKNNNFNIEFLGGEPMLNIDNIEYVIEYLENKKDISVIKYIITTNGTIINDKLLSLMNKYKNLVYAISVDGNKYANQLRIYKNGLNTYDDVINNIEQLKNKISNFDKQVTMHITVHPYNVCSIYESIINFINLGITKFVFGIIESTMDIDNSFAKRFIHEMNLLSKLLIKNKLNENIDISCFKTPNLIKTKNYVYDDNNNIIGETIEEKSNINNAIKTKNNPNEELYSYIMNSIYENHCNNLKG